MEEDIAGHGSKPLMHKAQGEGIYASFMPTDLIVTRLDQGLTLPPKIYPETLPDNGGSHKESTPKEHATKDSTLEANDRHLKDALSQANAGNNNVDCTNETQQEHTGQFYDPCQHIQPILHHQQEKLTDGPSCPSFPEQKQQGFYSSCQAPGHASELVLEQRLPEIQSAGCQGRSDNEPANQFQLARINGNIPIVCPMGGRAMPGSPRPLQDTEPQTQKPKGGDAGILCNRGCTTAIEQPVAANHLTSQQTDDLRYRSIGDRGQELTLSLSSKVERLSSADLSQDATLSLGSIVERLSASETSLDSIADGLSQSGLSQEATLFLGSIAKRLAGPELSSATLKGVVNKDDRKAAENVSALEQLQDEKSQDEKVQYGESQDKIHTSGQLSVTLVEQETEAAGVVCCEVQSPKAKDVEASLYSPIYKSPKANASSQVSTTIATTIRNSSASKHTPTTLQHTSLSTLYSSQPQLLALRDYIATAPLPSPGVRKIQQVILATMDGEIEPEVNAALYAQLEAIYNKITVDKQFLNGVIAFSLSKLGHSITNNDTSSSNQSSSLGANATASKAPDPKFNIKTCTLEELKEEYNACKSLAKKERQQLLDSISKNSTLEENAKELKKERDHWKAISSSVPVAKTAKNQTTKWTCTSCYLLNECWADLAEWAPGKSPNGFKPAPEEAGIPEIHKKTWSETEYCRSCGLHKSGRRPEENVGSPSKRKLANATAREKSNAKSGANPMRRCKKMEAGLNTSGHAAPTPHSFQAEVPGAQLPQVPRSTQDMTTTPGRNNGSSPSTQYLPDLNGTVADQLWLPSTNGTIPNQQLSPNGNGTVSNQQFSSNGNGTAPNQQQLSPMGNGTAPNQQFSPKGNGTALNQQQFSHKAPNQQFSPTGNGTVSSQQFSPGSNGTVPNQQFSPNSNGTIPGQQFSPNSNGTIPGQQYFPTGNGTFGEPQVFPIGNGTVSNQKFTPNSNSTVPNQQFSGNGNGTVSNQQLSSNSNGTIPGQQFLPIGNVTVPDQLSSASGSGTITGQQPSPFPTGPDARQQNLPSTSGPTAAQQNLPNTNGSITNQQLVPGVMGMFTDQFAGDDDLFANFDFDALAEDPYPMMDWLSEMPLFNTGVVTSATLQTPNALSPGQTTLPSTSATPSSVGLSKELPIEVSDDDPIFAISQADMDMIDSLTTTKSAPQTPAQPQSKVRKHTQPGVKYDMRGNQIGPSTLPTIRYRNAMPPRTARLGALTFPTSPADAAPKDAAAQAPQHPNGG